MRAFRWALVVAVVILAASAVSADPIDPQIIIRGTGTGTIWITSTPFILIPENNQGFGNCIQVFNVGPDSLDGWTCNVGNRTGAPITNIVITFGAQGPLACVADPTNIFSTCVADPNSTFFMFSGGVIPNETEFFIDFLGFADNTAFRIQVPEPGTLSLALFGLAGLLPLRRLISGRR